MWVSRSSIRMARSSGWVRSSGLAYGFSVSGPISKAYMRLPFQHGPDTENP
ncbi:hypothetical protein MAHJHV28_46010 [Mycobacterium avium subsp. hominissuis]